jgi:hypothetical protein
MVVVLGAFVDVITVAFVWGGVVIGDMAAVCAADVDAAMADACS